jgi:hypothetical protein
MRIRGNVLPLAAASVMVFSLFCGCAPKKQAVRSGRSVVTIRLPPVEAMDISLRSERREAPPKPPYSVADESRGRWLTLFEVNVSPVSTGNLPETESEEDVR